MSRSRAAMGRAVSTLVALLCVLCIPGLRVGGASAGQSLSDSSSELTDSDNGPVLAPTSVVYADVPADSWAYREIMACTAGGVVQGYPDGLYHPDLEVDRGSMSAFIARAMLGGESQVPVAVGEAAFPDVPTGSWASSYVKYLLAYDLVAGYLDGDYHPELPVDRGQMAVFIARAAVWPLGEEGLAAYTPPLSPTFSDVPPGSWCFKHVEYLVAAGVVNGYADGTYRPDAVVSRDQMAMYVARGFGID